MNFSSTKAASLNSLVIMLSCSIRKNSVFDEMRNSIYKKAKTPVGTTLVIAPTFWPGNSIAEKVKTPAYGLSLRSVKGRDEGNNVGESPDTCLS